MRKLFKLKLFALAIALIVVPASQLFAGAANSGKQESFPATTSSLRPRQPTIKPDHATVAPGYDRRHIEVKFIDDADIGLSAEHAPLDRSGGLLQSARAAGLLNTIVTRGGMWRRMSAISEAEIDRLVSIAEENLRREIADINNYFILTVPEGVTTEEWLDQLNELPEVEIALARPLPMLPPAAPGDFQSVQYYLNAAPTGIDALYGWTQPGGSAWPSTGPVAIFDFEYSWNLNHNDFPIANTWIPPGYTASDPFSDNNHGTGVLGIIMSLNNSIGTKGVSFATLGGVAPTQLQYFSEASPSWQLGVAMTNVLAFSAGSVFLIEQQFAGPNYTGVPPGTQDGLIPVEWWQAWYNIILTAVGNGIHVVEAAGNGQEDLDNAIYSTGNGGHWPFLSANNSGAIIVGAGAVPSGLGGSDVDRSRLWFSNWGSRVDIQNWGEKVVTTGYGDYYSAEGTDYWYTSQFSGTSSASAVTAGVVALIESINEEQSGGTPVSPTQMRNALMSTGSPQQAGTYPISQHIGPRPDIPSAIAAVACVCGDANGDGNVSIGDAVFIINYIFGGGPAPSPLCNGDANGDQNVSIGDAVHIINYIFGGGPAPGGC